jgi:hypothetical protein
MLLTLDPNLDVVSKSLFLPTGGVSQCWPYDIVSSSDGSIYCLYRTGTGTQVYATISKFDSDLGFLWSKYLGSVDDSGKLRIDNSSNVHVAFAKSNKIKYVSLSPTGSILLEKEINYTGSYSTASNYLVNDLQYNSLSNKICISGNIQLSNSYSKGFLVFLDATNQNTTALISAGPYTSYNDYDNFVRITNSGISTLIFGTSNCSGLGLSDVKIIKIDSNASSCCLENSSVTVANVSAVSNNTLNIQNPTISKSAFSVGTNPIFLEISSSCFE